MIALEHDEYIPEHNKRVPPAFKDYNFDARWWTGPINKIEARLAQVTDGTKELAVIVTTGAFCPIHQGHVQMLETAREELESRGMAVLGGYICPDHDRYVSSKIRSGSLSAAERLDLCELATEDSDWLMVDRWAAIYASSAVGFTTIIGHIDKMVNHHIKTTRPIRIVYAFGGDNAMFVFSFVARWSCVCVLRPGSLDRFQEMEGYDSIRKNPRIIFSNDTTAPLDSTSVRRGDLSGLLPKVKDRYLAMQQAKAGSSLQIDSVNPPSTEILRLRDEGLWAVQPFLKNSGCSAEYLVRTYQMFCEELQNVFELAFDSGGGKEPPYKIIPVQLRDQERVFQKLLTTHNRVISVDPCLPGSRNIYGTRPSKPLVKMPSSAGLALDSTTLGAELKQAEPGIYTLFTEHLSLNSETERLITENLPDGCTIARYLSHLDLALPISEGGVQTTRTQKSVTMNARNYLAGAHEGGTLLELGEAQFVRAPDVLPYVRPSHNAHITVMAEMGFSKAVWELNQQFFQAIGEEMLVKDMAPGFRALCETQGFPADMRMTELSEWHLEAFKDMVFQSL